MEDASERNHMLTENEPLSFMQGSVDWASQWYKIKKRILAHPFVSPSRTSSLCLNDSWESTCY